MEQWYMYSVEQKLVRVLLARLWRRSKYSKELALVCLWSRTFT